MNTLTNQRRKQLASEIYNISRRLRQISNHLIKEDVEKMEVYILSLNKIGTEILGGQEEFMKSILRKS